MVFGRYSHQMLVHVFQCRCLQSLFFLKIPISPIISPPINIRRQVELRWWTGGYARHKRTYQPIETFFLYHDPGDVSAPWWWSCHIMPYPGDDSHIFSEKNSIKNLWVSAPSCHIMPQTLLLAPWIFRGKITLTLPKFKHLPSLLFVGSHSGWNFDVQKTPGSCGDDGVRFWS